MLIYQLFKALGLIINRKKSLLSPVQYLEFLGFQACSTTLRFLIPKEKLQKIRQDAYHLLRQTTAPVTELARFVGKTASPEVSQSVPHHSEVTAKFSMKVQLPPMARADLSYMLNMFILTPNFLKIELADFVYQIPFVSRGWAASTFLCNRACIYTLQTPHTHYITYTYCKHHTHTTLYTHARMHAHTHYTTLHTTRIHIILRSHA